MLIMLTHVRPPQIEMGIRLPSLPSTLGDHPGRFRHGARQVKAAADLDGWLENGFLIYLEVEFKIHLALVP